MAIPKELDDLIKEYLTDGVITPQERRVLLNKAVGLGLNAEEIDLYIDAQEQKVKMQDMAAVERKRGKTCPHCGAPVPPLTDKCPDCGNHITPEATAELQEIIESLENALVDMKAGDNFKLGKANVEKNLRKADLYYSNNPKVKVLVEKVKAEMADAQKNKATEDRKAFFAKYWPYIVFGVVLLIEFIIYFVKKAGAESYMSDYHNHIGNRSDMFDRAESASTSANTTMFFIIITIIIGIYLLVKYNKKNKS